MAGPLNAAVGGEYRVDEYKITAGVPGADLLGGPQSFAGLAPTDVGSHNRQNEAVLCRSGREPIEEPLGRPGRTLRALQRISGSVEAGKLTARYYFTPGIAVRGTGQKWVRGADFGQEYFSSTNAVDQRHGPPAHRTPRAASCSAWAMACRPRSRGTTASAPAPRPLPAMNITADLYQIDLTNRIAATGLISAIYVNGMPSAAATAINAAIAAQGRADRSGRTRSRRRRCTDLRQWPGHAHARPRYRRSTASTTARSRQRLADGHDHRHGVLQSASLTPAAFAGQSGWTTPA